ncbi:UPF0481 protein [Cocos nucifera]|uniref:UPF0481 protein n=1 Tax=Cocos nucifera TaxID=13894 RepID=A0A8K0ITI3_COCNU|nr:UPF0481 protein [Cocos nucifera]
MSSWVLYVEARKHSDARHEGPSSPKTASWNEKKEIIDEESEETEKLRTFILIQCMKITMLASAASFPQLFLEHKTASIFKVPQGLREQSPEHCQPKVVSIGPYHRDDSKLLIQNQHKWSCVCFLYLVYRLDLDSWIDDMRRWEAEARRYYSEAVSMDSQQFLEMLLVDCCFIFVVLDIIDKKLSTALPSDQIMLELLLLGNQIPFFVLEKLNKYTSTPEDITQLALHSFGNIRTLGGRQLQIRPGMEKVHLLHLFRLSLYPADIESSAIDVVHPPLHHAEVESKAPAVLNSTAPRHVPSATELQDRYAVKFKKGTADNFLDIQFRNGVMEIPFLQISNYSGTLLCNLIAFEQCYRPIEPRVATYAAFMDCLINKESDADLLESNGILLNRLPISRNAAVFFSEMSPRAGFPNSSKYLDHVFEGIHSYQNNRWNRWKADLKLNYFSNPWVSLSVVAGAVLLIVGLIQTWYSVLAYYHR